MRHEFIGKPDYAMVRLSLAAGEEVVAEAGAMVGMSANLKMETSMRGGLLAAAKRKMLGGESLFMNKYKAEGGEGVLELAPAATGDVIHFPLNGSLIVQSGSYLASGTGIKIDTKFQGLKGFFSGEKLFMLRADGQGDLFVSSYGAIHEVNVNGDYVVDTGHIVAFEETLTYSVTRVGGWKATFLSSEGLVCRFTGAGKLYIQTRNMPSFISWVNPFRRIQKKNK